MTFWLSPQAEDDIQTIARYIAAESPAGAKRWIETMYRHLVRIGDMPGVGAPRFDIRDGLRMVAAGAYLILYCEIDDGAEIIRVLHGARQWQDLI